MRRRLKGTLRLIAFIGSLKSQGLYIIESPAPCPSEAHILSSLDVVLRSEVEKYGIAPAALRLAMWRLRCDIMKDLCGSISGHYLPVPACSLDADGFLKERYWGNATHANQYYGELVVEQIMQSGSQ
jgi:hypothetical protein